MQHQFDLFQCEVDLLQQNIVSGGFVRRADVFIDFRIVVRQVVEDDFVFFHRIVWIHSLGHKEVPSFWDIEKWEKTGYCLFLFFRANCHKVLRFKPAVWSGSCSRISRMSSGNSTGQTAMTFFAG